MRASHNLNFQSKIANSDKWKVLHQYLYLNTICNQVECIDIVHLVEEEGGGGGGGEWIYLCVR